jgi:transposase-like protein
MTEQERDESSQDDRRADAWHRYMTGTTMRSIAKDYDVSPQTISNWIKGYAMARRTRAENVEVETERIVGVLEEVIVEAWVSKQKLPANSMAGPSYLKTIVEAAQVVARLRGIDAPKDGAASGARATQVVVNFGTVAPERRDLVDVEVTEARVS